MQHFQIRPGLRLAKGATTVKYVCGPFEQLLLPFGDLRRMDLVCSAISIKVFSPRNAVKATFALKLLEWFRRVLFVMPLLLCSALQPEL